MVYKSVAHRIATLEDAGDAIGRWRLFLYVGAAMRYVLKRLLYLIPILFGITFVSFAMMSAAGGDIVTQKLQNTGRVASRETIAAARHELGLDRPFLVQYLAWLKGALRGDLGKSFLSGRDVFATFASKLPATAYLAAVSLALTAIISIPLGILAAAYRGSAFDRAVRLCSFAGNSLPNFFTALLLMYFFSIKLKVLPAFSVGVSARGVALPAATLAMAMSAKYLRQVRAAVLDELSRDYVVGAVARGVRFSTILIFGVLRSCAATLITLFALSAGSLLGGVAIVESIFMWDGVGRLAVSAINMRDYPMIQAYVMWMAIIYVCVNLIADVLCRAADPRIHEAER